METNFFVVLLSVIFGLVFIFAKIWSYDGYESNDAIEIVQIIIYLIDAIKDMVVIYYILNFLLY